MFAYFFINSVSIRFNSDCTVAMFVLCISFSGLVPVVFIISRRALDRLLCINCSNWYMLRHLLGWLAVNSVV